ncbi:MAG: helix-turn-helix domain-containing protein, partial [Nitrospira sp.]|nr:helix-turn-helix domain-containing protein [Nitrospira sp.]
NLASLTAEYGIERRSQMILRKPRGPQGRLVELTGRQEAILEEIIRCRHSLQHEYVRGSIILRAARGERNIYIAGALGIDEKTVRLWRMRWGEAYPELTEIESEVEDKGLREYIENVLSDAPRSGRPGTFSAEQICQIIAVACESPELSGRAVRHWTPRELTDEGIQRKIVEKISPRTVGRFLKRSGSEAPSESILAKQ